MPVLSLLNSLTDLNSRVIEQKKDRDYNCRVHTHTLSVCKTFWSQETNMLSRADRQHVPKVKVACSYASYARQIYRFQGFLRSRSAVWSLGKSKTRAEILVETSEFSRRHSTRRVSRKLSVYVMKTSAWRSVAISSHFVVQTAVCLHVMEPK